MIAPKGTKKPPQVGQPFRSYADSHYASLNRDDPVICKVREWDEQKSGIIRLYHYYTGNKKKRGQKRKRTDDPEGLDYGEGNNDYLSGQNAK